MSPTLLKKYLAAAREVASYMYLKEDGFGFAPHPMLAETDRDKFAVHQIIDSIARRTSTMPIIFKPPGDSGIGRRSGSAAPRWPTSRGNIASAPSIWGPSRRLWKAAKRPARW